MGAHQSHLVPTDGLAAPVACSQCHKVPAAVGDSGHLDGTLHAEVSFGALAKSGGANPAWDRGPANCSSTYCHGGTLNAGGTNHLPAWTTVNGTQKACGTCHGSPPPAPHPNSSQCSLCHVDTMNADGTIKEIVSGSAAIDPNSAIDACPMHKKG